MVLIWLSICTQSWAHLTHTPSLFCPECDENMVLHTAGVLVGTPMANHTCHCGLIPLTAAQTHLGSAFRRLMELQAC